MKEMNCRISLAEYAQPAWIDAWAPSIVFGLAAIIYAFSTRLREDRQKARCVFLIVAGLGSSLLLRLGGLSDPHIELAGGTVSIAVGSYRAAVPARSIVWLERRRATPNDLDRRVSGTGMRTFSAGWYRSRAGRNAFVASPGADAWLLPVDGDFDLVLPSAAIDELYTCSRTPA